VSTALGDEIVCTREHRFWVRGRDGETWREAGDLRADDYVMLDLSAQDHGSLQVLRQPECGHHREIVHDLPGVADEPFGLWLGWICGDGSVTKTRDAKFITVQIAESDPELVNRYKTLTRSVFGERIHFYEDHRADKPDASVSIRFSSGQV